MHLDDECEDCGTNTQVLHRCKNCGVSFCMDCLVNHRRKEKEDNNG